MNYFFDGSLSKVIALPAIAIAIVGRAITLERESNQKRSKELIPKRMQKGLRVITLQGAIEKSE